MNISDIVDHVFEQKIKDFLKFIKEKKMFGHITGGKLYFYDSLFFLFCLRYIYLMFLIML